MRLFLLLAFLAFLPVDPALAPALAERGRHLAAVEPVVASVSWTGTPAVDVAAGVVHARQLAVVGVGVIGAAAAGLGAHIAQEGDDEQRAAGRDGTGDSCDDALAAGRRQRLDGVDFNDEIEGVRGVRLAEIHDLKVVLNNNGSMEELWLYGEDGRQVASSAPSAPPPPPAASAQSATISQDQIQQARNIGDVVRFMVATENGRMIGYKVRPGRKRELFDQVGLKTDDIVVSVNGIEVNEPQKVREVYQALKTATEANLQVMRDGTTQSITITMSAEG